MKNDGFAGKTVVVSGSGNVATYAAEKCTQLGGKVVDVYKRQAQFPVIRYLEPKYSEFFTELFAHLPTPETRLKACIFIAGRPYRPPDCIILYKF